MAQPIFSARPQVASPPPRPVKASFRPPVQGIESSVANEGFYDEASIMARSDSLFRHPASRMRRYSFEESATNNDDDSSERFMRPRLGSAPSSDIKHQRERSHFSIPDVMVTTCDEEGQLETHFEVQLEETARRALIPSSTLNRRTSEQKQTPSQSSSNVFKRKPRPPAIQVVDHDKAADDVDQENSDRTEVPPQTPKTPTTPMSASSTESGSKFARRLRKSSLPSLFARRERDAVIAKGPQEEAPPTPPLPQFFRKQPEVQEEIFAPKTPETHEAISTSSSKDTVPLQRDRSDSSGLSTSSGQQSPATSADPSSPPTSPSNATAAPTSPLVSFFTNRSKLSHPGAPKSPKEPRPPSPPSSLNRKSLKQQKKEEKNLIKELERVDKMVRKHDKKALKEEQRAAERVRKERAARAPFEAVRKAEGWLPHEEEMFRASEAIQAETNRVEQGRTKKALRHMSIFQSTSTSRHVARRASIQRRPAPAGIHEEKSSVAESNANPTSSVFMRAYSGEEQTDQGAANLHSDPVWTDVTSPTHSTFETQLNPSNEERSSFEGPSKLSRSSSSIRRSLRKDGRRSLALRAFKVDTQNSEASCSPERNTEPLHIRRRSLLGGNRENAKYRIESMVLEGSDLGWEDVDHGADDGSSVRTSGQITPRPKVVGVKGGWDPSRSPTEFSSSLFDSIYKEVNDMELSFENKYPSEAEERRKSLGRAELYRNGKGAFSKPVISLQDEKMFHVPQPKTSDDSEREAIGQFESPKSSLSSASNQSIQTKSSPSKNHVSSAAKQDSVESSSEGLSYESVSSSGNSSMSNPATPPTISGFTPSSQAPFKSSAQALPQVPMLNRVLQQQQQIAQPPPQHPPVPQLRKMRVGANPAGFRFPPPKEDALTHQSRGRSGSLPINEKPMEEDEADALLAQSSSSPFAF